VNSLSTWAIWSIAAALLSPIFAFLMAVVVEVAFGLKRCWRARTPCACGSGRYRLVPTPRAVATPRR
jgi:hypothetical protein